MSPTWWESSTWPSARPTAGSLLDCKTDAVSNRQHAGQSVDCYSAQVRTSADLWARASGQQAVECGQLLIDAGTYHRVDSP